MSADKFKFMKCWDRALLTVAMSLCLAIPSSALTKTAPDVVVPNLYGNTFSTVVNVTGSEFLRLPDDLPVDSPSFIAAGDFNEDRLSDLVIVNDNSGNLTFMLGQGNGVFTPVPVPFHLPYNISVGLSVGDFNNDGHDDILVSDQGSSIQVLLGDGGLEDDATLHFTAQTSVAVGNRTNFTAVADFNEDGNLDAVVCDYNGSSVKILTGNGNGGLNNQQSLGTGERPESVAIGDFNADGHADFAVAGGLSQYASVYLGNGDGTFDPELQVTTRTGGDGTYYLAVGDLNNDGYDDIATRGGNSDPGGDLLVIRLWNPVLNNFDAGGNVPAGGAWLGGLTIVDFNEDGNQDVIFTNAPADNSLSIYFGDGAGNLELLKQVAVGDLPNGVAVIDVNPVVGDFTTKVRLSNSPEGTGDLQTFSTDEKLYVTIEDVKLTKDIIPETATVTIAKTEVPFVALKNNVFMAVLDLDAFPLGELKVKIDFKATVLDEQENVTDIIKYHRASKITLLPDSLRTGLVTYYPLNEEPKNNRVQDVSEVGNNGLVNGATFASSGKKGGAYSFDGISNTIAGLKGLGTLTEGSISFWINSDAVENFRGPFSGLQPAACGNVCTRFEQTTEGQIVVGPLQFQSQGVYSTIHPNQWHHVVLVWSTTQATGYLDGEHQFTVNLTSSNFNFTPVLGVGSFFGGGGPVYFKGLMDEVRIYNRPLTNEEVLKLLNI
ncbi:MAG: FG-GAP-like repeat-containing protein [Candidatus Omnitrophota bacterium]